MAVNRFLLSWQDISVSASTKNFWSKRDDSIILNKVNGSLKNGLLVGVIGPSGAGKTTFLSALAGRIPSSTGRLTINNRIFSKSEIKNITGYLPQHIIMVETLTVKEHLVFMTALKLNTKERNDQEAINNLISKMNMGASMNTAIRNISGGEKKKLALTVELLGNPMIIYCDEVTTGLDSTSAIAIIQLLHQQVLQGKLIITNIHQPSSGLFNYFNEIILMNRGQIVFQGSKEQTQHFFNSMNLFVPRLYNPADFYIHKIVALSKDSIGLKQLDELSELFRKPTETYDSYLPNDLFLNYRASARRGLLIEMYWLIWRSFIDTRRNLGYSAAHFGVIVVTATIISVIYANPSDDDHFVQNTKGVLYVVSSELIYTHIYGVLFTFPEEHKVFLQEGSLYSSYAYFLSKIVAIIPKCAIQSIVFFLITYLFVRFASGFLIVLEMIFILFLGCITATAYGLCISAIFQSLEVMEFVVIPLDVLSMLLSGIMLKVNSIPVYFRWLKYCSPFYYVYESLSILQWTNIDLACSNNTSIPCYANGIDVLEELGFGTTSSQILLNILGMCFATLLFCFIGYLGILRKKKFVS